MHSGLPEREAKQHARIRQMGLFYCAALLLVGVPLASLGWRLSSWPVMLMGGVLLALALPLGVAHGFLNWSHAFSAQLREGRMREAAVIWGPVVMWLLPFSRTDAAALSTALIAVGITWWTQNNSWMWLSASLFLLAGVLWWRRHSDERSSVQTVALAVSGGLVALVVLRLLLWPALIALVVLMLLRGLFRRG